MCNTSAVKEAPRTSQASVASTATGKLDPPGLHITKTRSGCVCDFPLALRQSKQDSNSHKLQFRAIKYKVVGHLAVQAIKNRAGGLN